MSQFHGVPYKINWVYVVHWVYSILLLLTHLHALSDSLFCASNFGISQEGASRVETAKIILTVKSWNWRQNCGRSANFLTLAKTQKKATIRWHRKTYFWLFEGILLWVLGAVKNYILEVYPIFTSHFWKREKNKKHFGGGGHILSLWR